MPQLFILRLSVPFPALFIMTRNVVPSRRKPAAPALWDSEALLSVSFIHSQRIQRFWIANSPVCWFTPLLLELRADVAVTRDCAASKTIQHAAVKFTRKGVTVLCAKVFIFVFSLFHFGLGVLP